MNFAWNFANVLTMDEAKVHAAGIAFQAPDGKLLFLKRSDNGDHAGEWCFPGGGIEGNETPEQAARREVIEETGSEMFLEAGPLKLLSQIESDEGVGFTTFIQPIVEQFTPVLNEEHDEFIWANRDNPPSPLHPGVAASLAQLAMDAEFNEGDHPRAPDGKFGQGSGGNTPALSKEQAKELVLKWVGQNTQGNVNVESGGGFSESLNKALRDGKLSDEQKKTVSELDSLIASAPVTTKTKRLYRGSGSDNQNDANPGFLSATKDRDVADAIGETNADDVNDSVTYEITIPPGSKILSLNKFLPQDHEFRDEEEHLLPRNAEFVRGEPRIDPRFGKKIIPLTYKVPVKQAQDARSDAIAFDKATVRRVDQDGHLHIEMNPISKANVCQYYGKEIPGFEELGLEANKLYRLLRDPEALKAGAATGAGKPIMLQHKPINAEDHPREIVVGAIGTDLKFEFPYLKSPLTIWDKEAIELIDDNEQRELSLAYRYKPDMTPGKFEGEPYDGRMLDIAINHLTLVKEGRAGPDVLVFDSAIPQLKELTMAKVLMSRRAVQTQGALAVFLLPKLAQDAKIDLTPVLKDVTNKNFKAKKKDLIDGVTKLTNGKLAQDATLAELDKLLDALGGSEVVEAADPEAVDADVTDPNAAVADPNAANDPVVADDPCAKLVEFLKGKGMSDEDVAAACAMMKPAATDEDPNTIEEEGGAMDTDPDKKPDMVSKADMKTAMDAMVKTVEANAAKANSELRAAERAVKPYVGELAMDHKSANEVYVSALTILGIKDAGKIHPSAYPVILSNLPLPGANKQNGKSSQVAMDAAAISDYDKMFPSASRIGNV